MIKNLALGGFSNRMPLLLGLMFGLVAAALAFVYLSGQDGGGGTSGVATTPVVVAASDIPAGTTISAEMVTLKDIAISAVIPEALRATDDVVGQVTTVQVVAGEQILPTKVSTTALDISTIEGELPISLVIPAGMRAFAIGVSEGGAAGGLVQPGDYIDVISTEETVSATDSNQTVSKACFVGQDLHIIALAQNVISTPASADQSQVKPASGAQNAGANTVTLAVTPAQAASLAAAQRGINGSNVQRQLWVAVRPFGEHGASAELPACS